MSSGSRKSKDKVVTGLQAALHGIQTYFPKKSLVIDGKVWTAAEAEALLQGQINALQSNASTYALWVRDVAAQRATYSSQVAPFMAGLRVFVSAQCGVASDEFLAFGFTPHKKGAKSTATKAQAVAQNLATRKARNTMGRKQKLAITGVVPSASGAPATSAAPAATTPSASAPTTAMTTGNAPNGSSGSSR